MKKLKITALCVFVLAGLTFYNVVASADTLVDSAQHILWMGSEVLGGGEFPAESEVWYLLEVHSESQPDLWLTVPAGGDSVIHQGAGAPHLFPYDVPVDGDAYQARIGGFVRWEESSETIFLGECLNEWVTARQGNPPGLCGWAPR